MKEEWKEIEGYDGIYLISTYGVVKNNGRTDRNNHYHPPKIVSQRKDKDGYCIVTLYNRDGIRKDCKVHRLVAMAFLPNPNHYPQVNHKNEIKDCNYVGNLEWCSSKYNANYGSRPYKMSIKQKGKPRLYARGKNNYFYGKSFRGADNKTSKKVIQLSLSGDYLNIFDCMNEAGDKTNTNPAGISMCCRGIRKTAGGYMWKYA